jgi:hypothetical protein
MKIENTPAVWCEKVDVRMQDITDKGEWKYQALCVAYEAATEKQDAANGV